MQNIYTDTPQKILVTCAKGMLGCDLCHFLSDIGHNVIETNFNTLNKWIRKCLTMFCIQNVQKSSFNVMHKQKLMLAEDDLTNSHLVNVNGTENLV